MFRSFLIALLLSTVVCIDDVRSGEEGTASNGGGVAEPVEDGDSSSFVTALDESEEHDEPTLRRAEDPFAFEREPEHPNLPSEALLRDPLHPLAYVFAHARSVQRFGWAYLGGSLLVLLIAENSGPKSRKPEAINKLLSLCLSFYWSTSACLVLSDSCRNLDCDVAFWSLAVIFMFQGLVFMVGGMILNRYHFSPLSQVRWTWNGVIGCCFWLYTLLSSLGHYSSSGDFFLLAFPVDAFTVAFLLTCGRFLHPLAYTLPIISCFSRALNTLLHFGLYGGEWALLVLSGCALWSLLLRFMYPPERPQRSRAQARRRPKPKPPVEAERLLFELPPGAQDVSGLEAVSRMMAKDEDGDAAHEFFDATADGGFVKRDTTKQD